MLRIISHIESLLRHHDCVIIPGIGGFVLRNVPASLDNETYAFHPMTKEIVFNTSLQHNDGLLAESYMKASGVNYNQALLSVQQDIENLRQTLQDDRKVVLGDIGEFLLDNDGVLLFQSQGSNTFAVSSYGLPVFTLPTLESLQREEVELLTRRKKADTIYIPISKRFLKGVAASAAAIAIFLATSTSVDDVNRSDYTAGFLPPMLFDTFPGSVAVAEDTVEMAEEQVFIPVEAESPVVEVVTPAVKKKMYHIIIGSFPNHAQADAFVKKIDQSQFPALDRIAKEDRVRVYANKFENKEEAEAYLDNLRKTTTYHDAWLFASR